MKELLSKLQKNLKYISSRDKIILERHVFKYNRTQVLLYNELNDLKRIERKVDMQIFVDHKYQEKYKEYKETKIDLNNESLSQPINVDKKTSLMIKTNDFDGVSMPWSEHPTILLGFCLNQYFQRLLIFRSLTTTFINYQILCEGVEIGKPIPKENVAKYIEVTGEEINEKIFEKVNNTDGTYYYVRPLSTALFGKFGEKPLSLVGYLENDKPQFAWSTFYVVPIYDLYEKHRKSSEEQPSRNVKEFAAEELFIDYKDLVSIYNSKNKSFKDVLKSDIYWFTPSQRKILENLENASEVEQMLINIENRQPNLKFKSIEFPGEKLNSILNTPKDSTIE